MAGGLPYVTPLFSNAELTKMMNTLLESRRRKKRGAGGTTFSVIFHSLIIFFAVYATANAGVARDNEKREEKVRFVEMKKEPPPPEVKKKEEPPPPKKQVEPKPQADPLPPAPKVELAPPKGFEVLRAPVNIPVEIPKVDLSAKVTNEADFSGKGEKGGTATGKEGGTGESEGTKVASDKPYFEYQVEVPVEAIPSTIQPKYPESLRASGVQGQVVAQFVVNENGRVEPGTFKVLSSDNPAFTHAVREELSSMRFKPARIGSQTVSQFVQQPFVFKLDR
jgi:protein TonB